MRHLLVITHGCGQAFGRTHGSEACFGRDAWMRVWILSLRMDVRGHLGGRMHAPKSFAIYAWICLWLKKIPFFN